MEKNRKCLIIPTKLHREVRILAAQNDKKMLDLAEEAFSLLFDLYEKKRNSNVEVEDE